MKWISRENIDFVNSVLLSLAPPPPPSSSGIDLDCEFAPEITHIWDAQCIKVVVCVNGGRQESSSSHREINNENNCVQKTKNLSLIVTRGLECWNSPLNLYRPIYSYRNVSASCTKKKTKLLYE